VRIQLKERGKLMKKRLKICLVGLGIVGLTTSCSVSDIQSAINSVVSDTISSYTTAATLNFVSRINSAADDAEEVEETATTESDDITDLLSQFDLILSNESSFSIVTTDSDRTDYTTKDVISFVDTTGETVSYTMYYSNISTTTTTTTTDVEDGWEYFDEFDGEGSGDCDGDGDGDKDQDRDQEGDQDHDRDQDGEGQEGHGHGDYGEGSDGQEGEDQEVDVDYYDVNGDGEITIDDIIADYDTNGDGAFDYTDYKAILEELGYEEFDANEDGVIDENDFITLFDFDEDGDVDADDFIYLFDLDGDGDFDEDDLYYFDYHGGEGKGDSGEGPGNREGEPGEYGEGDGDRTGEPGEYGEPGEEPGDEPEEPGDEPTDSEEQSSRSNPVKSAIVSGRLAADEIETSEEETTTEEETTSEDLTDEEETTVEEDVAETETNTTILTQIEGIAIVDDIEYPFFSTEYSEDNSDGSSVLVNSFVVVMNDEAGNESFLQVDNSIATADGISDTYFDYTYVEDGKLVSSYTVEATLDTENAQLILTFDDKIYFISLLEEDGETYILVTVMDPGAGSTFTEYKYERVTTTDENGEVTVTYVLVEDEEEVTTEEETTEDSSEGEVVID